MNKYPFLFLKDINSPDGLPNVWFVKIAKHFDYMAYKSEWMDCKDLGETCFIPDVDISEETHRFQSEEAALLFIKQWWSQQNIED